MQLSWNNINLFILGFLERVCYRTTCIIKKDFVKAYKQSGQQIFFFINHQFSLMHRPQQQVAQPRSGRTNGIPSPGVKQP